ncbi:metallophosphoesterase [Euzebyella marina]|uniref:Metallophosphoesterase n=1 Tax=Euzebyella marina TaxID=1761453 RepID=A0A3G2L152_9FLAO|nr:metallophosphoesterase [Euzebyella marina]AYN65965.1 metallophosphoesterase [Euzebyella marina]
MLKKYLYTLFILISFSCKQKTSIQEKPVQIAFLSDVHLLDVKGTLEDVGYNGIENPKTGSKAFIRTMEAQLHSTRLFNENYFAFLAALDDVVKKGIKIVALPGDFSDDGQPINVRGLNRILNEYSEKHGISFFITTGNHDPTSPFGEASGKSDFMGEQGRSQSIISSEDLVKSKGKNDLPAIVSDDIRAMGYSEIVGELSNHGFFPQKDYHYWTTPFTGYNNDNYTFEKAQNSASLSRREYRQNPEAKAQPDVSYLVEPVEGVWLVAIDANVYLPKEEGEGFQGASIGYNLVLKHKKYLIDWMSHICSEAKRLDKKVIAFSHFPMIDFNDGASLQMKELFDEKAFQAHRIPDDLVGQMFADAGLKIHFGGHMHLNDTGIIKGKNGNTLVNIQVPSLAAYTPAYKILEIANDSILNIDTVVLDSVSDFKEFFPLYEMEHSYLNENAPSRLWNFDVLASENYVEYTNAHLEELVRLRFLPSEWPENLLSILENRSGKELFILANSEIDPKEIDATLIKDSLWKQAMEASQKTANEHGLQLEDFASWQGNTLIEDFYRLRSGDELALEQIPAKRIEQYKLFSKTLNLEANDYLNNLQLFMTIVEKQMNGEPANHFSINLNKGVLIKR